MTENFTTSPEPFRVRRFETQDREAVLAMLPADMMHSQSCSETIDVLCNAVEGGNGAKHDVWIAEAFGRIIGSATVVRNDASLAHLQCLSVAPDVAERKEVARGLAEMAIRDAWDHGYLKLVVHTDLPPDRFTAFLHDLGFEFSRERAIDGDHVLEFYINLYARPRPAVSQDG